MSRSSAALVTLFGFFLGLLVCFLCVAHVSAWSIDQAVKTGVMIHRGQVYTVAPR